MPEVRKKIMTAYMPTLKSLRKKGKSRRQSKDWGVCEKSTFVDKWTWPKGNNFLFPSRHGTTRISKDVVCHNICQARKTFSPPSSAGVPNVGQVRSHSARHRKINDIKAAGVSPEAGVTFARIKHKKTWDGYGRLDQIQAGDALQRNKKLQKTLKTLYSKR